MTRSPSPSAPGSWSAAIDALRHDMRRRRTPAECRAVVASRLAPCEHLLERNAQISASYAALYLRHPDLFKWSGMAAFASQHVRKLLWLKATSANDRGSAAMLKRLLSTDELETIREINNAIHDDVFWAHVVCDAREDGLGRLLSLVEGTPMEAIGEGFSLIESGRRRLQEGSPRGGELILRGNLALLWHEQESVVQPHLARLTCAFARVFSLGSSLNYEPRGIIDCMRYCSSFAIFMLLREWRRLVRSRSLPRLDLLDHRWAWIERVLVPKFTVLEREAAIAKLTTIRDADPSRWPAGR